MFRKMLLPSAFVGAAMLVGCEASFQANPNNPPDRSNDGTQIRNDTYGSRQQAIPDNEAKLDERTFVTKAASGGLYEVKSSQLVLDRGVKGDLRSFAQRMIDDHSKANDQLKQLASRKRINVPDQMNEPELDMYNKLDAAQGSQLDQLYEDQQVKAHDNTIKLFQDARDQLSDGDLRNLAAEKLPILREHRQMLTSIEQGNK
jgi:putative membrane protein